MPMRGFWLVKCCRNLLWGRVRGIRIPVTTGDVDLGLGLMDEVSVVLRW
jgi:hypothetical protein